MHCSGKREGEREMEISKLAYILFVSHSHLQFEASLELPLIDNVGDIVVRRTLLIIGPEDAAAADALLCVCVGVPLSTSGIA